jgi:RNA polymerase sigma factor for flagellar operon FliA
LGLVDAVRRFSPAKSSLTTFAKHRIRGAILDGLRSEDSVSRTDSDSGVRRMPSKSWQSRSEGSPMKRRQPAQTDSLFPHGRISGDASHGWVSFPHSRTWMATDWPAIFPTAHGAVLAAELRSMLDRAIATLPLRYQTVIVLYYRCDLTMREIAGWLGVNESRVSQIHHAALGHLRRAIERPTFRR